MNDLVYSLSDKKSAKSEEDASVKDTTSGGGYLSKQALLKAIQDWIPEMYESKGLHHRERDGLLGSPSRRDTRQSAKSKGEIFFH